MKLVDTKTTVRVLTREDVERWHLFVPNPDTYHEYAAVHVEDLGECLAAVVHLPTGVLVWSDGDAEGTPIPNGREFVKALNTVLDAVHAPEKEA